VSDQATVNGGDDLGRQFLEIHNRGRRRSCYRDSGIGVRLGVGLLDVSTCGQSILR
jgi:hypothetical protein